MSIWYQVQTLTQMTSNDHMPESYHVLALRIIFVNLHPFKNVWHHFWCLSIDKLWNVNTNLTCPSTPRYFWSFPTHFGQSDLALNSSFMPMIKEVIIPYGKHDHPFFITMSFFVLVLFLFSLLRILVLFSPFPLFYINHFI